MTRQVLRLMRFSPATGAGLLGRRSGRIGALILAIVMLGSDQSAVIVAQSDQAPRGAGSPASVAPSAEAWRRQEVQHLQGMLAEAPAAERTELRARLRWLQAWQPGRLTDQPLWRSRWGATVHPEPELPSSAAVEELRKELFGGETVAASPSEIEARFEALRRAAPQDLGLAQLYVQWLDRPEVRKQNADRIADAAERLAEQLASSPATPSGRWAAAYAWYRCGRALAYRELADVVAARPIADPDAHDARLRRTWERLVQTIGRPRPEFVLLEIRMLRRDGQFGQALELLEEFGAAVDRKWLLKKRRDLLRELEWQPAAREAAVVFAAQYPELAGSQPDLPASTAPQSNP